ncbi:hypothetical protein ACVW1C_005988 [Bradyrhizobium sp. USDA 4011]
MAEALVLPHASIARPDLITSKALSETKTTDHFKTHINPGQLHFTKLLGFHKVRVERAENIYYYD